MKVANRCETQRLSPYALATRSPVLRNRVKTCVTQVPTGRRRYRVGGGPAGERGTRPAIYYAGPTGSPVLVGI
eukprot:2746837-Rhodomonas_salina.1